MNESFCQAQAPKNFASKEKEQQGHVLLRFWVLGCHQLCGLQMPGWHPWKRRNKGGRSSCSSNNNGDEINQSINQSLKLYY
jgi:hypothetical protein